MSYFFSVSLIRDLPILSIFSNNQLFGLLTFLYCFLVFSFIRYQFYLYYFFPLLALDLSCSSFSKFLRQELILRLFLFSNDGLNAIISLRGLLQLCTTNCNMWHLYFCLVQCIVSLPPPCQASTDAQKIKCFAHIHTGSKGH